jgi:hypothetical protein
MEGWGVVGEKRGGGGVKIGLERKFSFTKFSQKFIFAIRKISLRIWRSYLTLILTVCGSKEQFNL